MEKDLHMGNPLVAGQETLEAIKRVTSPEFAKYLNAIAPNNKCSFCGGDYGVSPGPDGKGTTLVATPSPTVDGYGVWHFLAACVNCGFTAFFLATHVVQRMKEGDK